MSTKTLLLISFFLSFFHFIEYQIDYRIAFIVSWQEERVCFFVKQTKKIVSVSVSLHDRFLKNLDCPLFRELLFQDIKNNNKKKSYLLIKKQPTKYCCCMVFNRYIQSI